MTDVEVEPAPSTSAASDEEVAAPTVGLRVVAALFGACLCTAGVASGSPWLIGLGIAGLVSTSVIPDRELRLPRGLTTTLTGGDTRPLRWLAVGAALAAVSIIGLFRRVEAGWPLTTWLIGLVIVIGSAVYRDVSSNAWNLPTRPSIRSFDAWMLTALTTIGFVLRVRQLETLPPMHGDEGQMGMLALRVGSSTEYLPPFSTAFYDHPTLFYYAQKLSMLVFGQSVSGIRMGSAIFGTLCIPAVYLVGRLGWSRRVGIVAAAILTFSHIHIQFSRMALNNIHSVLMATVMVACLFWSNRALKNRSHAITPLLSTGLTCGLAQYFYYGSRILPLILGVGLIIFAWRSSSQISQLVLVPFGFFLAWLPLLPRYLDARGSFSSRQRGIGVFSTVDREAIGADNWWDILLFQIERNLRFFIDGGDVSTFYFEGAPGLNLVAAILFWVGLGLALSKMRDFSTFIVLCWFLFGVVFGGVLTNGAPAATRLVVIWPALAVLGGLAFDHFAGLLTSRSTEWFRSSIVVALAVVLGVVGVRTYFGTFADDPPRAIPDLIGREFHAQHESADTFLIGAPALFADHGSIVFINYPDTHRDLLTASDLDTKENTKPELFVVGLPPHEAEMMELVDLIPGGTYSTVESSSGRVLYFTYLVDH